MKTTASLLLLFVSVTVRAEEISLRDAVDEALAGNPRVIAVQAATKAADARLQQARSGWLPRAELTATSTQSDNPVFVFGSLLEQGRFGQQHFDASFLNDPHRLRNDRLALNVRYTFFDQLRRLGSTDQARNASSQAASDVEELRQRIRTEVLRSYSGVAVARQRRAVAAKAVEAAKAQLEAMRDRLAEGLIVESDVLSAEVQLARFRQQEIEAEGDLAVARAGLATILGRALDSPPDVFSDIHPARLSLPSPAEAVARGIARRGEVKRAKLAAENARLEVRTARGSLLPRLDGYASWGGSGSTFSDRNGDSTYGLVASIDVFDPGKFARVAEARAEQEAAKATADAAADAVAMEIVSAYYQVRSAQQRVEVAAHSATQAAEAARIVRDRYANGLTTISEQLRAGTDLVAAELDLLAARHDLVAGQAELLRAMGELHDVENFQ